MPRSVEELVDRQMRRWAVVGRASAQTPIRPCLAMSRQPGAGAAELARRVAERLGYGCFDIEIVDWIARSAGLSRSLVAGVDEHIRTAVERFVEDALAREHFSESDYMRHLVRVISTLGERGSAVIVGRGSPYLLPPERALRLLIVAPRALRIENLAKQRSLPVGEAAAVLDAEDTNRRAFIRHHFKRDPDDATHYDLALNLGAVPMDAACELLVRILEHRAVR